MDDYNTSARRASKLVTETFSTSFSSASKLFSPSIRADIYNIYGLVRVADEIVDTYQGKDTKQLLNDLETETYQALERTFSTNLIVHAFMLTATKYHITRELIEPFFESMRTDLTAKRFTKKSYDTYIYGSAEVVGLMCLKVFCMGDQRQYKQLESGARSLGAAFQKVNFLRDLRDDYVIRGRYYFPAGGYESFDEQQKNDIVNDVVNDFNDALVALDQLPPNSQKACKAAYSYYRTLLKKLAATPADQITGSRISVSAPSKLALLLRVKLGLL